jgi:L-amino acid N-acyltransferase YncA
MQTRIRQTRIRPMTPEDWPSVRAIYEEGIATGDATFEASAPTWAEWDRGHVRECRIVATGAATATGEAEVLGWAALSPVSGRCVYAGVAEVSVYVGATARGRAVGRALLEHLIEESERRGYWTLQAGVFPENVASVALHRRCGFRVVGTRERLGEMNGRWRDVVLLERRSPHVGGRAS